MALKRTLLTTMAGALTMAAGLAQATTYTAVSGSNNWHNAASWSPAGIPGAGDQVSIPSGATINIASPIDLADSPTSIIVSASGDLAVNSAVEFIELDVDGSGSTFTVNAPTTIGALHITNSAQFKVNASQELLFGEGYMSGATSFFEIDGLARLGGGEFEVQSGLMRIDAGAAFRMEGAAPVLQIDVAQGVQLPSSTSRFEVQSPNALISGTGSMIGGHESALVAINMDVDDDYKLTLGDNAKIEGALRIAKGGQAGTAAFENRGVVQANAASGADLLLDANLDISDNGKACPNANWVSSRVSGTNSNLEFRSGAAGLSGHFQIDGDLTVNGVSLTTSGRRLLAGFGQVLTPNSGSLSYTGTSCP